MNFADNRKRKKKRNQTEVRQRLDKYSIQYSLNTPVGSYQDRPPFSHGPYHQPSGMDLVADFIEPATRESSGNSNYSYHNQSTHNNNNNYYHHHHHHHQQQQQQSHRVVKLSSRKITDVPYQLFPSDVVRIFLDDNKITKFVIHQSMKDLDELNLSQNNLEDFPSCSKEGCDYIPNLKILDVSYNNFSRGINPESLKHFKMLERLDLSYCELEKLPSEIGSLTNLTALWLEGNHLTQLPKEIIRLEKLTEFDARKNNLHIPWQYAVDQGGFDAVSKEFFLSSSEKASQHVKLILLGPPGIGKSVLRQKLLGCDPTSTGTTPRQQRYTSPDLSFELSVLDFSNLSTHEIFFSAYSFYLILWDMRKYDSLEYIDNNVQYWIDLVQSKVPGSTILIVGTNAEELITTTSISTSLSSTVASSTPNLLVTPLPTHRNSHSTSQSKVNITNITKHKKYQDAEEKLWQRLDHNEHLRVSDINRRVNSTEKGTIKNKLLRLLSSRPKLHHPIIPLHLSPSEEFIRGNSLSRRDQRLSHSRSLRDLNRGLDSPYAIRSDYTNSLNRSRSSNNSNNNIVDPDPFYDFSMIGRTLSETNMDHFTSPPLFSLPTSSSARLALRSILSSSYQSTVITDRSSDDCDDGTGIVQLIDYIAELVHQREENLMISPPRIECIRYRSRLNSLKSKMEMNDQPPYCTLGMLEEHLELKSIEDKKILQVVVEYWTELGMIMKFRFNSALKDKLSNVYLILDPLWLRECLSGLEDLKKEAMTMLSFRSSTTASPAINQRLERDRDNGFRLWSDIERNLIESSDFLTNLVSNKSKYEVNTMSMIRHVLQALNIIIPCGYRRRTIPMASNGNLQGVNHSTDSTVNVSSTSPIALDPIFLIPSLLKDGEKEREYQKYPKTGCIQLEKRIYLSKYFIPHDIIPRILARVYLNASKDRYHSNRNEYDENSFEGAHGLFYCWKTAFSQAVDNITVSVYLITPSTHQTTSTENNSGVSNNNDSNSHKSVPSSQLDRPYISITTSGHVLIVHQIVRLMCEYWKAVRDVLKSFPGLEYYKYSVCPVCLMKQRPPHQCGLFDDNASDQSSDSSDEEDEDDNEEEDNDDQYDQENNEEEDNDDQYDQENNEEKNKDNGIYRTENMTEYEMPTSQSDPPSLDLRKFHRYCPHGCEVRGDFYIFTKPSDCKLTYPTEATLQKELADYIFSQIPKSRKVLTNPIHSNNSSSLLSQSLLSSQHIPSHQRPSEMTMYYSNEWSAFDNVFAKSLVDVRVCKYDLNLISHEEKYKRITEALEGDRYNGYLLEVEGRKFVISSIIVPANPLNPPNTLNTVVDNTNTEANVSDYTYIVDCYGSNQNKEHYVAYELRRKSSKLSELDSLYVDNSNHNDGRQDTLCYSSNQHLFFVLEIKSRINRLKDSKFGNLFPITNQHQNQHQNQDQHHILLEDEFKKFQDAIVGSTVYILSYNEQRVLTRIYGRIIRCLPKESCGDLRGICIVSTKSTSHHCVHGALVIDCTTNRLVGIVLHAKNRQNDVYFVGTP